MYGVKIMSLRRCKECGHLINVSAGECPYCGGTQLPSFRYLIAIAAGVVFILLAVYLMSPLSR